MAIYFIIVVFILENKNRNLCLTNETVHFNLKDPNRGCENFFDTIVWYAHFYQFRLTEFIWRQMTDRSNIGSMKTDLENISKKTFQGSKWCLTRALINLGAAKVYPSLSILFGSYTLLSLCIWIVIYLINLTMPMQICFILHMTEKATFITSENKLDWYSSNV